MLSIKQKIKILKWRYVLPALVLAAISLGGCKKNNGDDEEGGGGGEVKEISYNGNKYTITEGRIWDYAFNRYESHYTYAYFVWNGDDFPTYGGYTIEAGDQPITLFYYLSSPTSTIDGVFEFYDLPDDWFFGLPENVSSKKIFTSGVVGFDTNGDKTISEEEVVEVTGGSIHATGAYTSYDLTLANGKTISGGCRVNYAKQQPPS